MIESLVNASTTTYPWGNNKTTSVTFEIFLSQSLYVLGRLEKLRSGSLFLVHIASQDFIAMVIAVRQGVPVLSSVLSSLKRIRYSSKLIDFHPIIIATKMEFMSCEQLDNKNLPIVIYHHDACTEHYIPRHPEQPARVASILKALRLEWPLNFFKEAPESTDEQILRFHTPRHLGLFKRFASSAEEAHNKGSTKKSELFQMIDGDTVVMWATRAAAYRAAGAVIAAIDDVFPSNNLPPKARSAFCCVRPPGHHAERNKACGFCFLSNAGIGALHAQTVHGIEKVAVLDFDVHHGNGTEEGFAPYPNLFYGSTHQSPNFPGTGPEPDLIGDDAVDEIHRRIVNRHLTAGPISREEFRCKWMQILQEMERFAPGLVIISAGFDAHDEDPLASCELIEEDFAWATQQIWASCARINVERPPPCVSVLEGGYDLTALASSAVAHVRALAAGPPTTTVTVTVQPQISISISSEAVTVTSGEVEVEETLEGQKDIEIQTLRTDVVTEVEVQELVNIVETMSLSNTETPSLSELPVGDGGGGDDGSTGQTHTGSSTTFNVAAEPTS
eukprot:gene4881-9732_t